MLAAIAARTLILNSHLFSEVTGTISIVSRERALCVFFHKL
jgi:hypothetical protein